MLQQPPGKERDRHKKQKQSAQTTQQTRFPCLRPLHQAPQRALAVISTTDLVTQTPQLRWPETLQRSPRSDREKGASKSDVKKDRGHLHKSSFSVAPCLRGKSISS